MQRPPAGAHQSGHDPEPDPGLTKDGQLEADAHDAITAVLTELEAGEPVPEWMRAAERAATKVRAARKLIQAQETIRFLRQNIHWAQRDRLPSVVERFQAALDDVLAELYPDGLPPDMAAYTARDPDDEEGKET